MKKQMACAALAAVVFVCGSGLAFAQGAPAQKPQAQAAPSQAAVDQAVEQLRKDARTDINTLITASMQFSAEDAAKFWPLYKTYEQTRKGITDERLAIIKDYAQNYAAMSDAKALELMQRAGFTFETLPVDVEESHDPTLTPEQLTVANATLKAVAAAGKFCGGLDNIQPTFGLRPKAGARSEAPSRPACGEAP